jgi:CBS-domain-containing membrane protein
MQTESKSRTSARSIAEEPATERTPRPMQFLTTLRQVMTPKPLWCYEDQSVTEISRLMEQNLVRRVIVLNRNEELAGVVSLSDLAVKVPNETSIGPRAVQDFGSCIGSSGSITDAITSRIDQITLQLIPNLFSEPIRVGARPRFHVAWIACIMSCSSCSRM